MGKDHQGVRREAGLTTAESGSGQSPIKRAKTRWTVYILRCADGSLYTGITRDLERRVVEHNSHASLAARYTRSRRPLVVVYSEPAATRSAAARREYQIKQMVRAEKERLISHNP